MMIHELAKLTGLTVRTLHYYDEIGLLTPKDTTKTGYRLYDETSLETLQQILFFKELDFPLKDIKEIMENPAYDKEEALKKHRDLLLKKRSRLDGLITLLDHTLKGEPGKSFREFDMREIEATKKKYMDEVKQRWGHTEAYDQSKQKTEGYDKTQWQAIQEERELLFQEFSQYQKQNLSPGCAEVQKLVEKWQSYITDHFYTCTHQILSSLGQMYVCDERFTKQIDRFGTGTAQFMAHAIEIYCENTAVSSPRP